MSDGTLFANFRLRARLPRAIVKSLNLNVQVLQPETDPVIDAIWEKNFPRRKVPCFLGSNGFKLTEALAVMIYLINLSEDQDEKDRLLGKTLEEKCHILKWLSFANHDFCYAIVRGFFPLVGRVPYNKKQVESAYAELENHITLFEDRLRDHTYLVTEKPTLADYSCAVMFARAFEYLYGEEWRAEHYHINRWFKTVISDPFVAFLFEDVEFCQEPLKGPGQK